MKSIFIVSGCGLLVLGVTLAVVAVALFVASRRKRAIAVQPHAAPDSTMPAPGVSRAARPVVPGAGAIAITPPANLPNVAETEVVTTVEPDFDPNATIVGNMNPGGTLECVSGPLKGRSFPVTEGGLFIGRDWSQSQIVIEDPRVSKRHVWIGLREGIATAIDQESTNGTFVNELGARIRDERLAPGDTLILPEDLARFTYRR